MIFMRILIFWSLLLSILHLEVMAQVQSGTIVYNHTSIFDTEGMSPQMAANMPKSADNSMQLLYDKTHSLYGKNPNFKEEINPNDNTPRFFRRMREMAISTYYKDLSQNKLLEQTSFFGKDFLVEDTINNFKWKVSAGEQKSILGYTCMKAYYKDSLNNLVVFFTPQIPLAFGPDIYGGLPGIILELQSAKQHIIATEINLGNVSIKQPSKGSKMTRKEFEKIKEDKIKEQTEMRGGNRRFIGH